MGAGNTTLVKQRRDRRVKKNKEGIRSEKKIKVKNNSCFSISVKSFLDLTETDCPGHLRLTSVCRGLSWKLRVD